MDMDMDRIIEMLQMLTNGSSATSFSASNLIHLLNKIIKWMTTGQLHKHFAVSVPLMPLSCRYNIRLGNNLVRAAVTF